MTVPASAVPSNTASRRVKQTGDIGSVFAQFSGSSQLPPEFARFKREIISSPELEQSLVDSWRRLLTRLEEVTAEIEAKGSDLIPEVQFAALDSLDASVIEEVRKRGTVVIRGVAEEAVEWERMLREYVAANPVTGFPKDRPQVYELYWSPAQMAARANANVLKAQRWANNLYHTRADPAYPVDLDTPISYADRARMRNPGDRNFNLGPHADCGSIELWEHEGYRKLYAAIFAGHWESYDAYDATLRDQTDTNLHDAVAYCGVFRTWQGWMALSSTGAGEGTLLVFPALREATAYFVLRPFFRPIKAREAVGEEKYLAAENWELDLDSSTYPGSVVGKTQEMGEETHPHLRLETTMVPMKSVRPGDYVLWHCEGIHAVEPVHNGTHDSSVLYIAPCPLSVRNAEHLLEQRECLRLGESGPDFPAGAGEGSFKNRGTEESIESLEGRRAMGLAPLEIAEGLSVGARAMRERANEMLFTA